MNSFKIDPFKCPRCNSELILYEVWHPKYGAVYNIFRDENWVEQTDRKDYVLEEEWFKEGRAIRADNQLSLSQM